MHKPALPDTDTAHTTDTAGTHHTPTGRIHRLKRPLLKRIGVLPTLLTLGNLVLGVGAVYMCCREMEAVGRQATKLTWNSKFIEERAPSFLSIGIWMLVGAIICDALDGRVARKTNQMTKFGEQMDSLADLVSWGVAPAMIMMIMVRRELTDWYGPLSFDSSRFGQLTVLIGMIYVSCAAMRLARFNVETTLDVASHEGFRGLPSPGAGGAVLTLVFLHDHLKHLGEWSGTANFITYILPFCALGAALLMVSNVPYRHMGSILMKRRSFSHFIFFLVFVLPIILLYVKQSLAILAWVFIISGLVKWVRDRNAGQLPQPTAESSTASSAVSSAMTASSQEASPKKNIS